MSTQDQQIISPTPYQSRLDKALSGLLRLVPPPECPENDADCTAAKPAFLAQLHRRREAVDLVHELDKGRYKRELKILTDRHEAGKHE